MKLWQMPNDTVPFAVEFEQGFAVLDGIKKWPTAKPHFLYRYWSS